MQHALGASRTTGNTDTTDIAIGLHLNKDGIQWKHVINATADYQHTRGVAGENKYLAGYEVNYKFNPVIFADGLVQWEKDRFAGFNNRETESLGLGYSAIHTPNLTLNLTLGPAVREIDQVLGPTKTDVEARLATQLTWNISPSTVFTENLNIYAGGGENTYESTTALTTKIINALAARASFDIKKESNPGPSFKKTDTTSRVTLVYGF
ncbi:MAG: DUF481 domain-containing protein [Rhodospirillaceae bacterium]|nr:MAG: DUF481 domain-containing protein [Rhodospirillaceae bacterium]